MGTSRSDAGARSPAVAHPCDTGWRTFSGNRRRRLSGGGGEKLIGGPADPLIRGHSPPYPDVTATCSWCPETTFGKKGPQGDLERLRD